MGALRKAGVWLGLVEEDDDRHDGGVFDDEYADYDDYAEPPRARSIARPRNPERRSAAERRSPESRIPESRAPTGLASDGYPPEPRPRGPYERDRREQAEGRGLFDDEPRPGADRATSDRARLDRPGTDRTGADRVGADRMSTQRTEAEGGTVRHLARSSGKTINFPTQDNLALAPQVQLNERAVVGDQPGQRYQITTLHPTSYSDARTIGEHFRDGRPVIINLTELDEADAKRLVDFAAGLAFGLRGGMDRVTNRVFLLTPANVEVSAEDKARIAEGRFFDQG